MKKDKSVWISLKKFQQRKTKQTNIILKDKYGLPITNNAPKKEIKKDKNKQLVANKLAP